MCDNRAWSEERYSAVVIAGANWAMLECWVAQILKHTSVWLAVVHDLGRYVVIRVSLSNKVFSYTHQDTIGDTQSNDNR